MRVGLVIKLHFSMLDDGLSLDRELLHGVKLEENEHVIGIHPVTGLLACFVDNRAEHSRSDGMNATTYSDDQTVTVRLRLAKSSAQDTVLQQWQCPRNRSILVPHPEFLQWHPNLEILVIAHGPNDQHIRRSTNESMEWNSAHTKDSTDDAMVDEHKSTVEHVISNSSHSPFGIVLLMPTGCIELPVPIVISSQNPYLHECHTERILNIGPLHVKSLLVLNAGCLLLADPSSKEVYFMPWPWNTSSHSPRVGLLLGWKHLMTLPFAAERLVSLTGQTGKAACNASTESFVAVCNDCLLLADLNGRCEVRYVVKPSLAVGSNVVDYRHCTAETEVLYAIQMDNYSSDSLKCDLAAGIETMDTILSRYIHLEQTDAMNNRICHFVSSTNGNSAVLLSSEQTATGNSNKAEQLIYKIILLDSSLSQPLASYDIPAMQSHQGNKKTSGQCWTNRMAWCSDEAILVRLDCPCTREVSDGMEEVMVIAKQSVRIFPMQTCCWMQSNATGTFVLTMDGLYQQKLKCSNFEDTIGMSFNEIKESNVFKYEEEQTSSGTGSHSIEAYNHHSDITYRDTANATESTPTLLSPYQNLLNCKAMLQEIFSTWSPARQKELLRQLHAKYVESTVSVMDEKEFSLQCRWLRLHNHCRHTLDMNLMSKIDAMQLTVLLLQRGHTEEKLLNELKTLWQEETPTEATAKMEGQLLNDTTMAFAWIILHCMQKSTANSQMHCNWSWSDINLVRLLFGMNNQKAILSAPTVLHRTGFIKRACSLVTSYASLLGSSTHDSKHGSIIKETLSDCCLWLAKHGQLERAVKLSVECRLLELIPQVWHTWTASLKQMSYEPRPQDIAELLLTGSILSPLQVILMEDFLLLNHPILLHDYYFALDDEVGIKVSSNYSGFPDVVSCMFAEMVHRMADFRASIASILGRPYLVHCSLLSFLTVCFRHGIMVDGQSLLLDHSLLECIKQHC